MASLTTWSRFTTPARAGARRGADSADATRRAARWLKTTRHGLSPRERQVAALLANGLTNRQIAERLVVSQRTVAAHIEHILEKLGFASRHQVGVWAAEHGLQAEWAERGQRVEIQDSHRPLADLY